MSGTPKMLLQSRNTQQVHHPASRIQNRGASLEATYCGLLASQHSSFCLPCRLPSIFPTQHRLHRHPPGLFPRQLFRPFNPRTQIRPRPRAVVFAIACRQFVGGFSPIMPALRPDVRSHLAIEERHASRRPPWTPQIRHRLFQRF